MYVLRKTKWTQRNELSDQNTNLWHLSRRGLPFSFHQLGRLRDKQWWFMPLFHFCSHHFARLQQAHSHPSSHSILYTPSRGWGLPSWYCMAQFSCGAHNDFSEILWDDGVNKRDRLILQQWAAEMYLAEASKSPCSPQPIHTGRKGLGEAAGNVGTHIVFTIRKHTLRQNRHAQYHILFSYRTASVSWSSEWLLNSTESRWRSCSRVGSSFYSCGNGSSFPSGSQGQQGPLITIASL